jgi:HAD superfamily hydrolase (TIGR01509 family)
MPLHFRAWAEALKRAGLPGELSEELFYSLGGMPTRKVAQMMADHYRLKIDADRVFNEKEELFVEMQSEMRVIKPVVEFARRLQGKAPMSVASGGPRPVVVRTLELMGLADLFPVVVTPEDVAHGKPAPDLFLLAAKRMGVPPGQCLVFEDADPGFRAAEAAGMQWVQVSSRTMKRPE